MNPELATEFVSCGCAKTPHCLDWGENNWIAFGSSYNVCLVRPEDEQAACQVSNTFCCHTGNVTVVKYVENRRKNEPCLLSGSADSSCVLWRQCGDTLSPKAKLMGHSMAVNYACGIFVDNSDVTKSILVATCSADSSLKLWALDCSAENFYEINECFQTVSFGRGFALCVDFFQNLNGILMAVGNDDNKIRLYHTDKISRPFIQVITLSGHEDWIRDIKFFVANDNDDSNEKIFIASCSQDQYVRLWLIKRNVQGTTVDNDDSEEIKLAGRMFSVDTNERKILYEVTLDAVLSGHESWVYSVSWNPTGKRQLVTASMDKSVIIWEPDPSVGVWFAKVRLGEVGGPVAGYYGAKFNPDGRRIVGHSFLGALHSWRLNDQNVWQTSVIPSGHFSSVEDIVWDPNGNYLMSCSQDQTTRLFGLWKHPNTLATYHEIARPQVHGHDLQCLACVSSYCFVSGAEEKIVRAFVAPRTFATNLTHISGLDQKLLEKYMPRDHLAEGASIPALGLSNKAVFAGDIANTNENLNSNDEANEKYPVFYFNPVELREPPTEDYLAQNTLWPEVHKLYGHGFEIFSVAANHAGTVVASACKASKLEHAKIILWSTTDWQKKLELDGNSLTVTEIAFSPSDKYLLTVSRDRTWFLYARGDQDFSWTNVGYSDKKTCVHARIIWSCAWTHDSLYFFTVSRDKKLAVWNVGNVSHENTSLGIVSLVGKPLDTEDSTTAVAIAPKYLSENLYLFAFGVESGKLRLYTWHSVTHLFTQIETPIPGFEHALTVKRLRFKPSSLEEKKDSSEICEFHLASCSLDHSIKIFCVKFSK